MTTDPRAALDRLVVALEAHLSAASRRSGEADPLVVAAYQTLADAFETYDEALYGAYDEVTPFVLFDEDSEEDDEDDDLDDDLDDDDLDDEEDLDEDDLDDDDLDDEEDDDEEDDDEEDDDPARVDVTAVEVPQPGQSRSG